MGSRLVTYYRKTEEQEAEEARQSGAQTVANNGNGNHTLSPAENEAEAERRRLNE